MAKAPRRLFGYGDIVWSLKQAGWSVELNETQYEARKDVQVFAFRSDANSVKEIVDYLPNLEVTLLWAPTKGGPPLDIDSQILLLLRGLVSTDEWDWDDASPRCHYCRTRQSKGREEYHESWCPFVAAKTFLDALDEKHPLEPAVYTPPASDVTS